MIVGEFLDVIPTVQHGFTWDGQGFTVFDAPFDVRTLARGINNAGHVVGYNLDHGGDVVTAFSYVDGVFTPYRIPDQQTHFLDINDRGEILGDYMPASVLAGPVHSFVLEPTGERVPIDPPFAGVTSTYAAGINNDGDVVGWASISIPPAGSRPGESRTYAFAATPRRCGQVLAAERAPSRPDPSQAPTPSPIRTR